MVINSIFIVITVLTLISSHGITGYPARPDFMPIDKQLRYYEVITFPKINNRPQQIESTWVTINFTAYQQQFILKCTTDRTLYSSDFDIIYSNGSNYNDDKFNRRRLVTGFVADNVMSNVYGYLHVNGAFQGHIRYNRTHYFIEPAELYFSNVSTDQFIIYALNDVISLKNLTSKNDEETTGRSSRSISNNANKYFDILRPNPDNRLQFDDEFIDHERIKRTANAASAPMACDILIHVDHTYTELHRTPSNVAISVSILLQGINQLYRPIDFDGNGRGDGVNVLFGRLKINTTSDRYASNNPYSGIIGSSVDYILAASAENNTDYCLFFALSARNFSGGALGIAFQSPTPGDAGVCSYFGTFFHLRLGFNTGIVSNLFRRHIMPYARLLLVWAHEIGHSYGADHDPADNATCSPKKQGLYLMTAKSESIDLPNNDEFSICSKSQIAPHLVRGKSSVGCFKHHPVPTCGNGIIDPGEECDCGYYGHCNQPCCNPPYLRIQDTPYTQPNGFLYVPCKLKSTISCNITSNPCYNNATGMYYSTKDKYICIPETACTYASHCTGNQLLSTCLPAQNKPNIITTCLDDYKVCLNGHCNGSLCLQHGYSQCKSSNISRDCELCCQDSLGQCSAISELAKFTNTSRKHVLRGSACSHSKGYCDQKGRCHLVLNPTFSYGQSFLAVSATFGAIITQFLSNYYWIPIVILAMFFLIGVIYFWKKSQSKANDDKFYQNGGYHSYTKSVAL
ncbi:Disintegrin and metalloproteinase domain-containing protein 10 [Trichoplax sp. H2]|nr:Disintegrin and metalloproteinase domain-containing protein 10 [Trichoplax sp. H2]|eukprot:RDD38892.1 Disintegrin and metalloproteinase domain-containing protein 10 [Trichoplax sp. H2]